MAQSLVFEWDEAKGAANFIKHGISFSDACLIFEGPVLSRPDDRHKYGERRVISIGCVHGVAMIVVVHTDRAGVTRLISARRASRRERRLYDAYPG